VTILVTLLLTGLPAAAADEVPTIDYIDIKPCKDQDPDVINVNVIGSLVPVDLPVAIYGDWEAIDETTVKLEGVSALEFRYNVDDYLLAKFDTEAVIGTFGDVQNDQELTLCLTGYFDNGGWFEECDDVIILKRGNR